MQNCVCANCAPDRILFIKPAGTQPRGGSIGASVTQLKGREGLILARTFKHSVALTLILGILVVLQQYVVQWMIP